MSGRRVVLVAGASGFLGVNLCRGFGEDGWEVHGIVRDPDGGIRRRALEGRVEIHPADLLDRRRVGEIVSSIRPDVIVNAAAAPSPRTNDPIEEVLAGTVVTLSSLLDAAGEHDIGRFLHLGSSTEYGPRDRPLREDDALRPRTVRGVTKAAATLLAFSRGLPVTVLRPFSVYGPWEHPGRLIPTTIRAALKGRRLPLTGPGLVRDLVFVEDVVEACLRAAVHPVVVGEVFNIGTGVETANEAVVSMISEIIGRPIEIEIGTVPPRPTDARRWCADIGIARAILGWQPRHDLGSGLRKTVDWFRSVGEW